MLIVDGNVPGGGVARVDGYEMLKNLGYFGSGYSPYKFGGTSFFGAVSTVYLSTGVRGFSGVECVDCMGGVRGLVPRCELTLT